MCTLMNVRSFYLCYNEPALSNYNSSNAQFWRLHVGYIYFTILFDLSDQDIWWGQLRDCYIILLMEFKLKLIKTNFFLVNNIKFKFK